MAARGATKGGLIVLCSLKYAPGLLKEFLLLGRGFARHGAALRYGLAAPYGPDMDNDMAGENAPWDIVISGRGGRQFLIEALLFPLIFWRLWRLARGHSGRPTYLFYNPHPIQPVIQLLLRLIARARIVTVLHEPNKTVDDLKNYGLKGFLYFGIAMVVQSASVRVSHQIVTMSPYGARLFAEKYPRRREDHIDANLLLARQEDAHKSRESGAFAFVGTVNRGKNIDDIIAAVNEMVAGRLAPVPFLIITASAIEGDLAKLAPGWEAHLEVINKPRITDAEIGAVMASARAILILHKTASQSGVLPMAYSYGTPVVARGLEAFTQYMEGAGVELDRAFTPADLVAACAQVTAHQESLCAGAARQFDRFFAEENFDRIYGPLLADMGVGRARP